MKVQKTKIFADITQEHAVSHFNTTHLRETADVQKIASEIEEIATNYNLTVIVINFSRLRQMTSAFLSKLVALNKGMKKMHIALRVCGMCAEVEHAYKICKLQKVIPLFATEAKALSG